MRTLARWSSPLVVAGLLAGASTALGQSTAPPPPTAVTDIMGKPVYAGATWGLRAVDAASGQELTGLGPDSLFFTGSTRKLFSVGQALNALGPDHRFRTPVHRIGRVGADGVLRGDLVLKAEGDLTLGGRAGRNGTVQYTAFDHTEANSLGSAILTKGDPLAGMDRLARQVRASGIRFVTGDVAVDDRLFTPFRVPNGNVLITPIVLNDNLVDVTIQPTTPGRPARISTRPKTAYFTVRNAATTGPRGSTATISLKTSADGRTGVITGRIPVGYTPGLPGVRTLVQTFTPKDPSAFARTAFIEALERHGVTVDAPVAAANPRAVLPASGRYPASTRVATLVSPKYSQHAKLILKVSHNYGANLSLMLFAGTKGARTISTALAAERVNLTTNYGIPGSGFDFPTNGSGSPDSRATPGALTAFLRRMQETRGFTAFYDAQPILGVDGSLQSVGRIPFDPVIATGFGKVRAKTGTTVDSTGLKAQVFAGYLDAKSGKRVAYVVYVNNVTSVKQISDVIGVFNDEGAISALLVDSL